MSDQEKKRRKRLWMIVLILSLLLLFGGGVYYVLTHPWWNEDINPGDFHTQLPTADATQTLPAGTTETSTEAAASVAPVTTESPLLENPIDFEGLWAVNPSVYAWINVPLGGEGKDIDYPILQSDIPEDDNFYLHKNIYKQYQFSGCIYTQKANAKDFSDRVTVIYGHNMLNGTMFSNLIWFQDPTFFDQHDVFYIYTPGHKLTYRIAAAVQFDSRHILNSFDFSDDQVFEDWIQNYMLNPRTMMRCVREGLDITIEDKIVILSTCLEHGAYRYLIQGVLISDEPTT